MTVTGKSHPPVVLALKIRVHLTVPDLGFETAADLRMQLVEFVMEIVIYPRKKLCQISLMKLQSIVILKRHGGLGL